MGIGLKWVGLMKVSFKSFAVFAAFLFLFSNFSFAQNSNSESNVNLESVSTDVPTGENSIILDTDSDTVTERSPNGFWVFVRMVLVLVIVILLIWFVMKLVKKGTEVKPSDDPFLRRVASINLAPGKSVQIVTIQQNCYVLGVTDGGINLISQITDVETINAMNTYADKVNNTTKPNTFEELLEIFMPNGFKGKKTYFTNDTAKPAGKKSTSSRKSSKISDGASDQILTALKKTRSRIEGDN